MAKQIKTLLGMVINIEPIDIVAGVRLYRCINPDTKKFLGYVGCAGNGKYGPVCNNMDAAVVQTLIMRTNMITAIKKNKQK